MLPTPEVTREATGAVDAHQRDWEGEGKAPQAGVVGGGGVGLLWGGGDVRYEVLGASLTPHEMLSISPPDCGSHGCLQTLPNVSSRGRTPRVENHLSKGRLPDRRTPKLLYFLDHLSSGSPGPPGLMTLRSWKPGICPDHPVQGKLSATWA